MWVTATVPSMFNWEVHPWSQNHCELGRFGEEEMLNFYTIIKTFAIINVFQISENILQPQ